MNTSALNLNQLSGAYAAAVQSTDGPADFTTLSSDMLLAYCAAKMSTIDGNITNAMNTQETSVKQQQALQTFSSALTQFAPKGPQNEADFQKVKDAYAALATAFPAGDPALGQCKAIIDGLDKSLYTGQPKNVADANTRLDMAKRDVQTYVDRLNANPNDAAAEQGRLRAMDAVDAAQRQLTVAQTFPDRGNFTPLGDGQWSAKCTTAEGVLANTKSSSEMQMIKLQSMVSQRQTVIQLVTGMMSKLDQAAETAARAIGGG